MAWEDKQRGLPENGPQLDTEPWAKRARRHMVLAEAELEEMTEIVASLHDAIRVEEEAATSSADIGTPGGVPSRGKQPGPMKQTTLGLVLNGQRVCVCRVCP